MPTLAEKIQSHFQEIQRPATGTLFLNEYARHHNSLRTLLAAPYDQDVTAQGIFNVASWLPCGRILSPAEVGIAENSDGSVRPVLSDHGIGWVASLGENTSELIVALIARVVLANVLGSDMVAMQAQLNMHLERHPWSFDYAGIARVAVLLAAEAGEPLVTARTLANATVLLVDVHAWTTIRDVLGQRSPAWDEVSTVYRELRDAVLASTALGHDQLLSAAVFPHDDLVPIPVSLKIADVRPKGAGLRFAWPGTRAPAGTGPLAAAPDILTGTSIITHMVFPAIGELGFRLRVPEQNSLAIPIPRFLGKKTYDGGWRRLVSRAVEHTRVLPMLEAAGWTLDALLAFVESGALAGGKVEPPALESAGIEDGAGDRGAGAQPFANGSPPPSPVTPASVSESLTFDGLIARMQPVTTASNRAVVHELALLADHRLETFGGARVLLLGPPGSGKSTLLARLASVSGRAFVRVDASALVEHGWQGTTMSDLAAMIYRAAGADMRQAERAIVVLDEFCKIAARARVGDNSESVGSSYWGAVKAARQSSLLALLDSGPGVIAFSPEPSAAPLQLRTAHMLVYAAGAFAGIRASSYPPTDQDLEAYGFLPELVSRLTTRLVLPPPTATELRDRLLTDFGGISALQQLSAAVGLDLQVSPEAVDMVARAAASGSGALSPRTGVGLLESAVRRALLEALHDTTRTTNQCIIGPDEILPLLAASQSSLW